MSSTRLPVFGNVARVALWEGSRLGAGWWRSGAFLVNGGVKRGQAIRTYCGQFLFPPEVRMIRGVVKSDGTRFWELGG